MIGFFYRWGKKVDILVGLEKFFRGLDVLKTGV
jgi:hypothetical protein